LSKKSKGYFVISQICRQQQLKSAAAPRAGARWQTQGSGFSKVARFAIKAVARPSLS